jgi:hypothetical protein
MSFLEIVAKNYSYWKPGLIALEARHRLAPIEGQKENKGKERKEMKSLSEKKLTVTEFAKTIGFIVLAIVCFFGLWGIVFLLSLPLMNIELSIFGSLLVSGITILTVVAILTRKRPRYVLSRRQKIGAYIAYAIIVAVNLPLIKINPPLFLAVLPTLIFAFLMLIQKET